MQLIVKAWCVHKLTIFLKNYKVRLLKEKEYIVTKKRERKNTSYIDGCRELHYTFILNRWSF
jgi:hypothetical protein